MTRGQIQHVFSFILITLVIVATIYLSITLFGTLSNKTCQAEHVALERAMNELSRTYDSVGTKQDSEIIAPCGAEYLCIFSQDAEEGIIRGMLTLNVGVGIQEHLAIAASLQKPKPNVMVFEQGVPTQELTIVKFLPEDNALCIRASGGRFTIHTEGHGRTISVSIP